MSHSGEYSRRLRSVDWAAIRRRRRVEVEAWAARVNGWAEKVYGDDGPYRCWDDLEEEFIDWLALGGAA